MVCGVAWISRELKHHSDLKRIMHKGAKTSHLLYGASLGNLRRAVHDSSSVATAIMHRSNGSAQMGYTLKHSARIQWLFVTARSPNMTV